MVENLCRKSLFMFSKTFVFVLIVLFVGASVTSDILTYWAKTDLN